MAGGQVASRGRIKADRWVMLALGLLFVVGAFFIEQLASKNYPASQWLAYAPWLIGSGVMFLLAFIVLSVPKYGRLVAFSGASFLSLAGTILLLSGANSLAESRSSRILADVITKSLPAGAPVFSFQYYPEAAGFYLGRPITIVEYEGELAMGIRLEPEKHIRTQDEFLTIWQNLEQAAVVLKLNRLKNLNVEALHGKVVYKGPKTMVIIKS